MKSLLIFLLMTLTTFAFAGSIKTRVYDILEPTAEENNYLLLLESGDVFELSEDKQDALAAAWFSKQEKAYVTIRLSDFSFNKVLNLRESILDIKLINEEINFEKELNLDSEIPTPLNNYIFSQINNMQDATVHFNNQRSNTRWRSQCYNRAHVWSYELKKQGVNSGKIWIFFTKRYIREYRYRWWFHVSPYIKVVGQNEEIILDKEFTRKPYGLKDWKNIFMKNKATCPVVEYYSDYRDHFWEGAEHCYLIKSSMFYWLPSNIEGLEKGEAEKTRWVEDELKQAYRNAVRGWNGEL